MKTALQAAIAVTVLLGPFLAVAYIESLPALSWAQVLQFAMTAAAVGAVCLAAMVWLRD